MSSSNGPDIKKLIMVPAIVTLVVTLARLFGELGNLPGWLASKEAGGGSAIIGITWLAPIFAIYFAFQLADQGGPLWKKLMKTLFAYGLAARIPVIIIMGLAIFGNWGTHYDAFPPELEAMSPTAQFLLAGIVTQTLLWAGIWTTGIGTIVGLVAVKLLGPKQKPAEV